MAEPTAAREGAMINETELLRRYEEKKRLLGSAAAAPESKPVFREAFREEVAQTIPSVSAAAGDTAAADVSSQRALDRATKEELKALVAMALAQGVFRAIQKAMAETPYLIDALHDELADHYYQKLVEAGLIS